MIGEVQLMVDFVNADLWDISLPYTHNTLPQGFSASQRHKFLAKQDLVSSKAANIEGGSGSSHATFSAPFARDIPF